MSSAILRDGLTWLDEWLANTESAYSIFSKLKICNPMRQESLVNIVFEHAGLAATNAPRRSLLFTDWFLQRGGLAALNGDGAADQRARYRSAQLSRQLDLASKVDDGLPIRELAGAKLALILFGRGAQVHFGDFARFAASDGTLRYCPRCISDGFHSILCQFDAVRTCPKHRTRLLDFCKACGAPTGSLTLRSNLFDVPFCCSVCQTGFGHAHPGAIMRWVAPGRSQGYDELACCVEKLSSVRRLVGSSWRIGEIEQPPSREDRIVAFSVGLSMNDIRVPSVVDPSVLKIRCTSIAEGDDLWDTRRTGVPNPCARAGRRKQYIDAQFVDWRDCLLEACEKRPSFCKGTSIQMAAQRGKTDAFVLGTLAAVWRLEELVGEGYKRVAVSLTRCNRPFFEQLPNQQGWKTLFQRVLEEERFKAYEWKAALDLATEGSDQWHRLISVYAEPYRAGRLSAAVYCCDARPPVSEAKRLAVANFGAAFRDGSDWYGFKSRARVACSKRRVRQSFRERAGLLPT